MNLARWSSVAGVATLAVILASPAHAGFGSTSGFVPRVPISSLGQPAAWFDPSRLHVSTSVTVGSGWGTGTSALQVTSFAYQFRAPMWMSVNLGNAWGGTSARGGAMFLEGLNIGAQPFQGFTIQVHYQNLRSPLQVAPEGRLLDRNW